jgi:uncharacterized RDD family membrane protein YckC
MVVLAMTVALPVFAQPTDANTNAPATNAPAVNAEDTNASPSDVSNTTSTAESDHTDDEFQPGPGGVYRETIVAFHDVVLKSNDVARTVVVIGANAKIYGKVREAFVVIGGDAEVGGTVGRAAVDILGDIKALKGAVFGEEVVTVGGRVDAADDVKFSRTPVEIDPAGLGKALRAWLFQCVFKLRPLAPQVGFVWVIWAAFFLIYFLVALILPAPVTACVTELGRRPATTFFMGLLAKILIPLVFGILIATGVGAIVVPFVLAALIFGAIVGKVALFEFLGGAFGRRFGTTVLQNSLISFLIGVLIITSIYMIPVLGLVALGVVSVWGIGGAVTAAFWGLRKEKAATAAPSGPASPAAPVPPFSAAGSVPAPAATVASPAIGLIPGSSAATNPEASTSPTVGPAPASMPGAIPAPPAQPSGNIPEAYAYPRAGFWERMAAAFLDLVLVGFLTGFLVSFVHKPQLMFVVALVYFAGMWIWKSTTVGGVVLGLKVVRQDGYPVTMLVSIVRALAAAFSIVIFFLGFLWIVFDRERQGWHDKIAGTVVIKLPKGTPLVLV